MQRSVTSRSVALAIARCTLPVLALTRAGRTAGLAGQEAVLVAGASIPAAADAGLPQTGAA
jgi:hypothetical protein